MFLLTFPLFYLLFFLLFYVVVVAGSKNVHLMARTRADIDFYADGRFQVARTVAKTVFDTLESLGELLSLF